MKYFLDLGNGVVVDYHTAIKETNGKDVGVYWVPGDATARGVDADCRNVSDRLIIRVVLLDIYIRICAGYRYKSLHVPVNLENSCVPLLHHLNGF